MGPSLMRRHRRSGSLIVNLADSRKFSTSKVTMKVEADNAGTVEQIKARTPQIRDTILVLTSLDWLPRVLPGKA